MMNFKQAYNTYRQKGLSHDQALDMLPREARAEFEEQSPLKLAAALYVQFVESGVFTEAHFKQHFPDQYRLLEEATKTGPGSEYWPEDKPETPELLHFEALVVNGSMAPQDFMKRFPEEWEKLCADLSNDALPRNPFEKLNVVSLFPGDTPEEQAIKQALQTFLAVGTLDAMKEFTKLLLDPVTQRILHKNEPKPEQAQPAETSAPAAAAESIRPLNNENPRAKYSELIERYKTLVGSYGPKADIEALRAEIDQQQEVLKQAGLWQI